MHELPVVLAHVRLQQSPPVGTRIAIALLGGLVAMAITAPVVRYLWGRPEPVEALEDVALRVRLRRAPVARIAGVAVAGMLVAVLFELLAVGAERLWNERIVVISELTVVDVLAGTAVVGLVFVVGLLAVHVVHTGDRADPTVGAVYRRWFAVSVGFVAVTIWAILVLHDLFWIAGVV